MSVDWDFYVAANEKCLLVHNTLVWCKVDAVTELALWDKRPPRRFRAKAQGRVSEFLPAGRALPVHACEDN
jgi:hypothetical protein